MPVIETEIRDFTTRMNRVGAPVLSRRGEYVCNIATMLFNLVPGRDEYNPEMGLAIKEHAMEPHVNGVRDTDYENTIKDQFQTYTDLRPVNVIATYVGKIMMVFMDVVLNKETFVVQVESDMQLATLIEPKTI